MKTYGNSAGNVLTFVAGAFCLCFLYFVTFVQAEPNAPAPEGEKPALTQEEEKPGKEVDLSVTQQRPGRGMPRAPLGVIQFDDPDGNMVEAMPVIVQSDYWIGVQVLPVPPALLSQFDVKEDSSNDEAALAYVDRVVPDSPAAKAGLKRGDILITLGEKKIHSLSDVIEQVEKVKGTEQKIELIREGKKTELKVTPEQRPEEMRATMPPRGFQRQGFPGRGHGPQIPASEEQMRRMMQQLRREMERMQQGMPGMPGTPGGMPGVVPEEQLDKAPAPETPKDGKPDAKTEGKATRNAAQVKASGDEVERLEVSTATDAQGKTTISVKQIVQVGDDKKEKKWEVEKIDELPKEIQETVKAMIDR